MTIREAIDRVDTLNPNTISEEDKIRWLSLLDNSIYIDIYKEHFLNPGEEKREFEPYSTLNTEKELFAEYPYDDLYVAYLQMKIDEANKETDRYNNSAALYNAYLEDYTHHYHKTHRPINRNHFRIWG